MNFLMHGSYLCTHMVVFLLETGPFSDVRTSALRSVEISSCNPLKYSVSYLDLVWFSVRGGSSSSADCSVFEPLERLVFSSWNKITVLDDIADGGQDDRARGEGNEE